MESTLDSKIRMWIDDNEHFLGEEIDTEKMKRFDRIRALCLDVSEADPDIWDSYPPFTERSRNGMACLEMPSVKFQSNPTVLKALSQLFAEADACITSAIGGELRITFVVHDMWKKFGYDNDLEHGDDKPKKPNKPDLKVIK